MYELRLGNVSELGGLLELCELRHRPVLYRGGIGVRAVRCG